MIAGKDFAYLCDNYYLISTG